MTSSRKFLYNAAIFALIALPSWLWLQGLLAIVFVCSGITPSNCGVTFTEGLFLYVVGGGPMAVGALLHYGILLALRRLNGRIHARVTAVVLLPVIPLAWVLTGTSPLIFSVLHLTVSLVVALLLYAFLMRLPAPVNVRAPA